MVMPMEGWFDLYDLFQGDWLGGFNLSNCIIYLLWWWIINNFLYFEFTR